MNRPHLVAAICFAIALAFYYVGMTFDFFAGFFLLGGFFELVAWKNAITAWREKRAASA